MGKFRTVHVCQQCGHKTPKWMGRCPGCQTWHSMTEEVEGPPPDPDRPNLGSGGPVRLAEVPPLEVPRLPTGMGELDRILGGGLVPGSVILLGGDPGIGKSTLALQAADALAGRGVPALYATSEESAAQTRMRAERLGLTARDLWVVSETNLDAVARHVDSLHPRLLVLDSIQTVYKPSIPAGPGTVTQVRECATEMVCLAKRTGMAVLFIGHVTKDGAIAGPKTLEHLVDAVLYFEGDRYQSFRIVRGVKNRFGSTDEIGLFEMTARGLAPVADPSRVFLGAEERRGPGSVVLPAVVGTRTLLVEVQALTARASYGMPARRVSGADFNRVAMLLAVLERRAGLHLGTHDVFVNVAGGLQVNEPAADLAIAVAVASAFSDRAAPPRTAYFGEVGLDGELRPVSQTDARCAEASRLGFGDLVVPEGGPTRAGCTALRTIRDVLDRMG